MRVPKGVFGLVVVGLVLAGCGSSLKTPGTTRTHFVYHVSMSYTGVARAGRRYTYAGWVDPAGNQERTVRQVVGGPGFRPSELSIEDRLGSEIVNRFSRSLGRYGVFVDYGSRQVPHIEVQVVRAWLGQPSPLAGDVRATRAGDRTRLTVRLSAVARIFHLPGAVPGEPGAVPGAPPSFVRQVRHDYATGTLEVSILGRIPASQADARGLFRIDRAAAVSVNWAVKPGTPAPGKLPAYWLGPVAAGYAAQTADVFADGRGHNPHRGYSVTYGRGSASVDVTTGGTFPRPSLNNATTITLADGTHAEFRYIPPVAARGGAPGCRQTATGASCTFGESFLSAFEPSGFMHIKWSGVPSEPASALVILPRTVVTLDGGSLTRAEALRLAEALRPV